MSRVSILGSSSMKLQAGIQDYAVKVLSQRPLYTPGSQGHRVKLGLGVRLGFILR